LNTSIFAPGEKDWTARLWEKTPVELVGVMHFKRDDYFAPLGYGGINGSKLRQCIWLLSRAAIAGAKTIVSGSSVKSPQISMGAIVARQFGMDFLQVVGATKPDTAMQHENVRIGAAAGAKFFINKVAYNPGLQKTVDLIVAKDSTKVKLDYGISIPKHADPSLIRSFHTVGGGQTKNIPPEVETLIVPMGSANSAVSILFGLWLYKPANLKKVILAVIGPNKFDFLKQRLDAMGALDVLDDYTIEFWDIQGEKYALYEDEMPASYEGIEFHPTYEGKIWHYMEEKHPQEMVPSTLFWIVGSKPYFKNMADFLPEPPQLMPLI
jgi:1-aminocyclopropane-1-carboxylate deaminase/D-cysteine desulfhydrase-like pyridoxal-dependent ACC family enzyme